MSDNDRTPKPALIVPRDLPMPSYDYQKPVTGTFTVVYDESRERDRHATVTEKLPVLQNLKLAG
jgi:hypothetical protein